MEPSKISKALASNESFEVPTLMQSPLAFNDKSTLDVTKLSAVDTSAFFSPSPKRAFDSCESPIKSPLLGNFESPVKSTLLDLSESPIKSPLSNRVREDRIKSRRSHSALEQKLIKIQESSRPPAGSRPFTLPENMKIAIQIEDEYEYGIQNKRIVEVPRLQWCASCKAEKMTRSRYVNNSKTFLSSVGICLSGGFLGCCMLPYMMNSCKGIETSCTSCGRIVQTNN